MVTHAAALGWTVALGVALVRLVQDRWCDRLGAAVDGRTGPGRAGVAPAAFWLALAVGIALVGLAEAGWLSHRDRVPRRGVRRSAGSGPG